jgi:FAD synthase
MRVPSGGAIESQRRRGSEETFVRFTGSVEMTDCLDVRDHRRQGVVVTQLAVIGGIRLTAVCGVVEHGDERGRELGFPTANLSLPDRDPRDGVWAGWVADDDGGLLPSAISIGRRSTFYGTTGVRLLEAHVLDFDGDLYDREMMVVVGAKLRGQRRFAGFEQLLVQLRCDVEDARAWCEGAASEHVRPELETKLELLGRR